MELTEQKTLGQVAYEAWCHSGRKIPEPWELKNKFERLMWDQTAEAVAKAVRESCSVVAKSYARLDWDDDDPANLIAEALINNKGATK